MTVAVLVLLQPVEVLVTVTVYVPDTLTAGFWSEDINPPGPVQLNVAGVALVVVFKVIEVATQVSCPLAATDTVGGWMLLVAVVEAVEVQPFEALVTRNV